VRKVGELFGNGGLFTLVQENFGKFFLDGKNILQTCAKKSAEERIFTQICKGKFLKIRKKISHI
jgi:hypothetical protein